MTPVGWKTGPTAVRIIDFPVFRALGFAETPAALIGLHLLARVPVAIDRGAKSICIPRR